LTWHTFFSGRVYSDYAGLAWTPGVCNPPFQYGMTAYWDGGMDSWNLIGLAHEVGHGLGSDHDWILGVECEFTPFAMSYNPLWLEGLSPRSIQVISEYVNGTSCLSTTTCEETSVEPVQVTGVEASASGKGTRIEWEEIAGDDVTGYSVWRASDEDGEYEMVRAVNAPTVYSVIDDARLTIGHTYSYKVRADNLGVNGSFSEPISEEYPERPADPENIVVDVNAPGGVRISWDEPRGSVEDYLLAFREGADNAPYNCVSKDGKFIGIRRNVITPWSVFDGFGLNKIISFRVCAKYSDGSISVGATGSFTSPSRPARPRLYYTSQGDHPDRIEIRWSIISGAESYLIYRHTETGESCSNRIAEVTDDATYTDSQIEPEVEYTYEIKAVVDRQRSDCSNPGTGYASILPPLTPESLSASQGTHEDAVRLNWASTERTLRYQLFRSLSPVEGYTFIASVNIPDTSYHDWDVSSETQYFYKIRAVNQWGNSEFSSPVMGWRKALAPPSGVEATDGEWPNRVVLTWAGPSSERVGGYKIYRSSSENGSYRLIGSIGVSFRTYSDFLSGGAHHWYAVSAIDGTEESDRSIPNEGYIRAPDAPLRLAASDGTYPDKVEVSWDPVIGAVNYIVYRALIPPFERSTAIGATINTVFDDTRVTSDTPYWYRVVAINGAGASPPSNIDRGKAASIAVPQNVSATQGTREDILVAWDEVPGANAYDVYRAVGGDSGYRRIGSPSETFFVNDDVWPESRYFYRIKAVNRIGESRYSEAAEGWSSIGGHPNTPIVRARPEGEDHIYVWWLPLEEDNWNQYTTFELYRSEELEYCRGEPIATFPYNVQEYNDYNVSIGTQYWYSVKAIGRNESVCSRNISGGRIPPAPPVPPINIEASNNLPHVKVSWNWVAEESGPIENLGVWRSFSPEGRCDQDHRGQERIGSVDPDPARTDYEFTDETAVLGITYFYRVQAFAYGPVGRGCSEEAAAGSVYFDCNENGISDFIDIQDGTSTDCDGDGIPDECQSREDCNDNGFPDRCEMSRNDCNGNNQIDSCEIENGDAEDCNGNFRIDSCEINNDRDADCDRNCELDECQDEAPDCEGAQEKEDDQCWRWDSTDGDRNLCPGEWIYLCCFVGDTTVLMADGSKQRIDEVEVGDLVLARDEDDFSLESTLKAQQVTQVFVHQDSEVLRLTLDRSEIDTTSAHPFFVSGRGWVAAGELEIGDTLTSAEGQSFELLGKEILADRETVYNVEVERAHTFFVGDESLWVHNKTIIEPNVQFSEDIRIEPPDG